MAFINVNPNVDDVFYRYKMPRLLAKVEGKGNGIKTVIANMPEIAKALNRPPTYTTKYFGCELGAQTQFDLKNERYIVNGDHDANKLQELLYGFVRKFVLCPNCENPETKLTIKNLGGKKQEITQSCMACGHVGTIDQRHKLSTFILKNPPPLDELDVVVKKVAKVGKKGRDNGSPTEENGEEGLGDFDVDQQNGGSPQGSDPDDDDGWTKDSQIPNGAADVEHLSSAMASLVTNPDLDKPIHDRLDMFYNFLLEKLKEVGGAEHVEQLNAKAIVTEADRLGVKDRAALLLCRALFDVKVLETLDKAKGLLVRFTYGSSKAQRYFLGGIEQLVTAKENKSVLLPKIAILLKRLYDLEILEEEAILEWGKKPSKKYVSKEESKEILTKAEPLLKWLREAEEESDEDDEDEQVEFEDGKSHSKPAAAGKEKADKKPATNGTAVVCNGTKPGEKGSDEDDLNIDDI